MVLPPNIPEYFKNLSINRVVEERFQLTFSCNFDYTGFPFDSHECPIEYGGGIFSQKFVSFNTTRAGFGDVTTKNGDDPIIVDNLPFPFEFRLSALPNFEKTDRYNISFSWTGIVLTMERKSLGQLLIGYFYPTSSFALLSMISFLIKPDMVRSKKHELFISLEIDNT